VRSVADCKAAAIWRGNTLCEKHGIIKPRITYNLRGTDAGQAFLEQNRIDLNLLIFMENFADGIQNTIPHEIAHLEAYRRGLRRGDFHGERWKKLMRQFGRFLMLATIWKWTRYLLGQATLRTVASVIRGTWFRWKCIGVFKLVGNCFAVATVGSCRCLSSRSVSGCSDDLLSSFQGRFTSAVSE